jgi:acyl-CoA reductase-like NAD-dependent aldehyde dehydrogenase
MSTDISHPTELLIGGERAGGDGPALAVENPFTTETIAELNAASPEQVEAAVAAAREAWPGWAQMTAGERCELLHEVARRLRRDAEELARTMTAEGGKPGYALQTRNSFSVGAIRVRSWSGPGRRSG